MYKGTFVRITEHVGHLKGQERAPQNRVGRGKKQEVGQDQQSSGEVPEKEETFPATLTFPHWQGY